MTSTLGIGLRVDSSEAKTAKQELLDTAKALDDLSRHSGVSIDIQGGAFAEMARQMNETMRKLENLNSRISATGGQKTVAQEQEAVRLMQKQKSDASEYEKILAQIGNRLDALYERKKKLERTQFVAGSDEQIRAKDELDKINKELDNKTSLYEKIQGRYDPRIDRALKRSTSAAQEIAGYETKPEESGGGGLGVNWWQWGKRGLLIGAGILGYRGLASIVSESKDEARELGIANVGLAMRGGGLLTRDIARGVASDSGYKSNEQMEINDLINRNTGLGGDQLFRFTRSLMRQGRETGVGGDTLAQYVSATFPATFWGKAGQRYDGVQDPYNATFTAIKLLRDSAVALSAGGRLHEVLDTNAKLLTDLVGRRSGKEMTLLDQEQTTMMQMALWGAGKMGQGVSGVNLIEAMDQGIRGGGQSPGMQALIFQAMGGEGVKSRQDIWNLQLRQAEGASVRNVVAVLDYAEKFGRLAGMSKEDADVGLKQNLVGLGLSPQQAEFLGGGSESATLLRKRLRTLATRGGVGQVFDELQNTPEGKRLLAEADKTRSGFDMMPGVQTVKSEAEKSVALLELGGKIQDLKNAVDRATAAILEGIQAPGHYDWQRHRYVTPMPERHLPTAPRFSTVPSHKSAR
jgi:hypothetical protein